MQNQQLTSNPLVYGIISQSPLFKVAFPDAIVVMGVDLASKEDSSGVTTFTIKDGKICDVKHNIANTQGAHNELYPNGSTMQ